MDTWPDDIIDFSLPEKVNEDESDLPVDECRRERYRLAPLILVAKQAAWSAQVKTWNSALFTFRIHGSNETKRTLSAELKERFPNFEYQWVSLLADKQGWKDVPTEGAIAESSYRIDFGKGIQTYILA